MSKILLLIVVLLIQACASYTTPGAGVQLSELADGDINELMARQPAASFPANISVARVQAPGYRSHTLNSFGVGRYSVITTRDVESELDFKRINNLPGIRGIAPLNRILLPNQLDSVQALREASARLRADMLMIYTFDTSFQEGEQVFAPLNVLSLGFLKNKKITVFSTVSVAFYDVRTEFLYGLAEASAAKNKYASVWGSADTVDDLRLVAEQAAFNNLLPEIENTWAGIMEQFGRSI